MFTSESIDIGRLHHLLVPDPEPVLGSLRPVLRVGPVELRPDEFQAFVDGRRAHLSVRQFQLLQVLVEHDDQVLERGSIYGMVWGGAMPRRDRSVDVLIRKLRAGLHDASAAWSYVHTHYAVGYRFHPEPTGHAVSPDRHTIDT